MARDNAKMIDENGDLHVTCILDRLDSLYGVSMTFQLLNAALCDLQQKPMESARAYYTCLAQITVILREHHDNRYRLGELARMSKDCFYAGALARELPYGGSLEGPAPHHPFGPIEGAVGAGGEQCPDTYTVPTVHLCQIDTPTEAGGALPLTATH